MGELGRGKMKNETSGGARQECGDDIVASSSRWGRKRAECRPDTYGLPC